MRKAKYLILTITLFFSLGIIAQAQNGDADSTSPAAVLDLAISATTVDSVTLTWTAPGDDGLTGTSTSYIMRYDTAIITTDNWSDATDVDNESTPQLAGSEETLIVSGLDSSTTYYFALKSTDEVNNDSDLSNIVSETTLAAVCGNDVIEEDEQCDDGNLINNDDCSATCQEEEEPEADVEIEIKVTPRSLNLSSKGKWISVHLYLPSPYKATQVDLSSVKLNDSLSPDGDFRGINRFDKGNSDKEKKYSSLIMKFSRAAVIELVGNNIEDFVVIITGNIGEESFSASETINVLSSTFVDDDEDEEESCKDDKDEVDDEDEDDKDEVDDEDEDDKDEVDEENCKDDEDEDDEDDDTLVQVEGENEVYVIKNNRRRHIPSAQAFNRHGYQWSKIKMISQIEIDAFEDDQLIRSSDGPEVYLIVAGIKRHIPSVEVFESYGFDWSDVSVVSRDDLDDYNNVKLIRKAGGDKVYLLTGGKRHWVPSVAVFNKYGYKWENVIIINTEEEEAIELGGIVE